MYLQGLEPEFVARLSEFSLAIPCLRVQPSDYMEETDFPTALRNTLRQLGELHLIQTDTSSIHEVQCSVQLAGWAPWSQQCAQAVADTLPACEQHSVGVHTHDALTDEELGVVLAMGPHMRHLAVKSVALQSDSHADTPWPWDELWVDKEVTASQLCKLPNPAGSGAARVLSCDSLIMDSDTVQVRVFQHTSIQIRIHIFHLPRA